MPDFEGRISSKRSSVTRWTANTKPGNKKGTGNPRTWGKGGFLREKGEDQIGGKEVITKGRKQH